MKQLNDDESDETIEVTDETVGVIMKQLSDDESDDETIE